MSIDFEDELRALAKALQSCSALLTPGDRENVLVGLGAPIRERVKYADDASGHVLNIVRACSDLPGTKGIDDLLKVVGYSDGQTRHWPNVVACADALKVKLTQHDGFSVSPEPAIPASSLPKKSDAPPARTNSATTGGQDVPFVQATADERASMPLNAFPADPERVFQRSTKSLEGACALVIGISKYAQTPYILPSREKHITAGEALQEQDKTHPFPDLGFSADDARAFHRLLSDSGCLAGEEPLMDQKATRRAVMRALDELCRRSRTAENPLVVIFFSGHGARDAEERYYLVPHDGRRDDLFATALWTDTFKAVLRRLPETSRVIVFVDACHAGGIGAPGEKGVQGCDPMSLVDEGRYVVASCPAEQVSHEAQGHGIFSQHLLELLRFEGQGDEEELELFGLYGALRQRVVAATHGQQEPWSNVQASTGIVLAVNHERRKIREQWEQSLLDEVETYLKSRKAAFAEMSICLSRFIYERRTDKAQERLCECFREVAERLQGFPPLGEIDRICDSLTYAWKQSLASGSPARATLGLRERSQSLRGAKDEAESAPKAPVSATPSKLAPVGDELVAPTPQPAPQQVGSLRPSLLPPPKGEKRVLKPDDVKAIIAVVWDPQYSVEAWTLRALLDKRDGVSPEEYTQWCLKTQPPGDENAWISVVRELGTRFKEAWDNGQKPQSPLSLRLQ